jgi:hypothetical protein
LGKVLLAKQIAMEIYGLAEEKVDCPIIMGWKMVTKENSVTTIPTSTGSDNLEEQQNIPNNNKQIDSMHKIIQL